MACASWVKVEYRLFSFINQNWRGRPLTSYETIVNLIAATTTRSGLKVHCRLDMNKYPLKQQVSDKDMATIRLYPNPFHGEWNYEIKPRQRKRL